MSFQIVIFNITEKSIIEHITAKSYNTAVINRGVHFKMKKSYQKMGFSDSFSYNFH